MFILVEWSTRSGIFVALGPKMYQGFDSETSDIKRSSKGVPHSHKFIMQEWLDMLLDENAERSLVEINSLRLDKNKKMCRMKMKRKSLSDIHLKTNVQADKVTCVPLSKFGKFL